MKSIGSKIKSLREEKNMTQEKLGEMILHKKSTVSK
jgi:transcriptional regulator with XRE-family HTH domain